MYVILCAMILSMAAFFALRAFQNNLLYFYTPTQVLAGEIPAQRSIRVGGMVKSGSLTRSEDGMEIRFVFYDENQTLPVYYRGIVPDLFREGQGAIAQGRINENGIMVAEQILAKHDERYMPPGMEDSKLKNEVAPILRNL